MQDQDAIYPSLKGRSVFVTGGASGIGAEIVRAFARQGARVGFVDINPKSGAAMLDEIGDAHAFAACDLRDIDALKEAFAVLVEKIGAAEVLVNNAASDDRHDWREVTAEYWDDRTKTNLRHMFFAIQTVAPAMIAAGRGSIINMGSNSWWEAGGGFPAYDLESGGAWADTHHGAGFGTAPDKGEHRRARLGDDRAAKGAVGHAGGAGTAA